MLRHRRLCRRAVAALEFALVAPVLVIMIISVFEICKALIIRQEVINTAHSISLTASLIAVQGNGTTALSHSQVQAVESDIFVEIPWLRDGIEQGNASVTLSGIEFSEQDPGSTGTVCAPYTNCATSFSPYVAWSVPYQPAQNGLSSYGITFAALTRPCGKMTSGILDITGDANTPITYANFMTTLRVGGITYPDPILVADVSYTETISSFPLTLFAGNTLTFVASAYWPVRVIPFNANTSPGDQIGSGELTVYDPANQDKSGTAHCKANGVSLP